MIAAKKPYECSANELQNFLALVLTGGEVSPVGLEARINKAETLLFLAEDGCLKGIAAVKSPDKSYKDGVFRKAHATVAASQFPFELGWVFVHPLARGAGSSYKLVEVAVSATNGQAIFATSRADNAPMHKVLKKHGFSRHGETYASTQNKQKIALFVRYAAQQEAPGATPKAARP